MSALKVLFVNKSQTIPYDAQKMNAQDANELKLAINANADYLDTVAGLNTGSFAGQAQTSTNPATPSGKVWYFAKPGTYTHFLDNTSTAITVPATSGGNAVVSSILFYNGTFWEAMYLIVDLSVVNARLDAIDIITANQPTFTKVEQAFVNGKEIIGATTDTNGDVVQVFYKDGSSDSVTMTGLTAAIGTEAAARIAADAALQTSLNLKANIADIPAGAVTIAQGFVNGREILQAVVDSNGDVVQVIYADGTSNYVDISVLNAAMATEAAARAAVDTTLQNNINLKANIADIPAGATVVDAAFVNGKEVLEVVTDVNGDVLRVIYKDGTTNFGDIPGLFTEVATARGLQPTLNDRFKNTIKPYAIPTTAIWGGERLRRWVEWNRSRDYRYDWLLIGDSYTHAFYSPWLRKFLMADGYPNGGAGWCSFSRWGTALNTTNTSVNPEDLDFTYTPSEWDFTNANSLGLNGYVTCNAANAIITINATELLANVTLVYEKHSGAGSFQYRINGGSWTAVSCANATQTLGYTVINTSALVSAFTIDIQALSTGIIMMGCIGRKTGYVLNIHKAGISGGNAGMFAQNQLWSNNATLCTPKGVAIMFGTNEKMGNTSPDTFRTNIQNIITKVRAIEPYCDILLMSPTYTTNETEAPTTYSLDAYAQVLFELAVLNDAAFINYAQVFGAFSQDAIDAGFMNADRVHPGVNRGSKLMAETFVKLLK